MADAGGVGAISTGALGPLAAQPVPIAELLSVSEEAVMVLFGTLRTAALRLPPEDSADCVRDFNKRAKTAKLLAASGQPSPQNFFKPIIFFYFQQDHALLLRSLPLDLSKVDAWAYGFARWSVVSPNDVCNGSDFFHLLSEADRIELQLNAAHDVLEVNPSVPLRSTLRAAANNLIARFCDFRQREVTRLVALARGMSTVAHLASQFEVIGRAYTYENATISDFLSQLERTLNTQAHGRATTHAKEEFVSRAWVSFYRAFISGLRGADRVAAPRSLNPPAIGPPAREPAFAAGFQTPSGLGTIQTVAHVNEGLGAFASTSTPLALGTPPGLSVRWDGAHSAEIMARQVMAGCRTPGKLLGPGNGSANGIDLPNDYCRLVLFANQVLDGTRHPGYLSSVPPAVLPDVPPLSSLQFGGYQRAGGDHQLAANRDRGRSDRPAGARLSNDICTPFSPYMLGVYSPYRDMRLPEACYECNAPRSHYGNECPQRFARVLGDVPPGWMLDGRSAVRNPAHWEGSDLTAAARADYRRFLTTHSLQQHRQYPVSADDIAGAAPPPLRRALGGRGQ